MSETLVTYIVKKLFFAFLVLMVMLTMVFFVMRILPGDPVRTMWPEDTPLEEIQRIRDKLGLNKPIHLQFIDYLSGIFRGDFGVSYYQSMPVLWYIGQRYKVTLELMLVAWLMSVITGIPLGIVSALKHGTVIDHAIRFIQLATWAVPSFWLAQMLQMTLGMQLRWFPVFGRLPPTLVLNRITGLVVLDSILNLNINALYNSMLYLFLPSLSIAAFASARLCRVARAEMLNALTEDYITTARAKGVKEIVVVYKHAFRNALLPTVTIMSLNISALMGGSVLTEKVFAIPGMGTLLIDSVLKRDFPLIQGIVIIYVIIVVVINTATDILYRLLDPRIKF